ncbi:MAG: GyrI-like domain-containing protein [Anaerolineae bacterium]
MICSRLLYVFERLILEGVVLGGLKMYPCEIKQQAAQQALSIRFRAAVQDLPKHFGRVYGQIMQYLETLGEQHTGAFAAYYNMDMQYLDVEAGCPVLKPLPGSGEIKATVIRGGTVAVCHYTGPYDAMPPVYEQLMQFVKEQGYVINGPAYEWYLNGPDEVPPEQLKTDIVLPVMVIKEGATV